MRGTKYLAKIHSEIAALEAAKHFDINWKKAVLYVYRQHRNGNSALAKPCAACRAAIKQYGIRTVIYSDENEQGFSIENMG